MIRSTWNEALDGMDLKGGSILNPPTLLDTMTVFPHSFKNLDSISTAQTLPFGDIFISL